MCSAFNPDSRYNKSIIKQIGYVLCPKRIFLDILCVHRKNSQSLRTCDCQGPQCKSVCQVHIIPLEERTNSFFLKFGGGIYIFEETEKSIQDAFGDVFCPTCPN